MIKIAKLMLIILITMGISCSTDQDKDRKAGELMKLARGKSREEQLKIYNDVISKYPKSKSAPEAMYFIYAFPTDKNPYGSSEGYKKITKNYPDSIVALKCVWYILGSHEDYEIRENSPSYNKAIDEAISFILAHINKFPDRDREWDLTLLELTALYKGKENHMHCLEKAKELLEYYNKQKETVDIGKMRIAASLKGAGADAEFKYLLDDLDKQKEFFSESAKDMFRALTQNHEKDPILEGIEEEAWEKFKQNNK